jgi:hypothetical protein
MCRAHLSSHTRTAYKADYDACWAGGATQGNLSSSPRSQTSLLLPKPELSVEHLFAPKEVLFVLRDQTLFPPSASMSFYEYSDFYTRSGIKIAILQNHIAPNSNTNGKRNLSDIDIIII